MKRPTTHVCPRCGARLEGHDMTEDDLIRLHAAECPHPAPPAGAP